jgi:hypothetical protein
METFLSSILLSVCFFIKGGELLALLVAVLFSGEEVLLVVVWVSPKI